MSSVRISFQVNNEEYLLPVSLEVSLADFLRDQLGLDESSTGCDTRQCGACVVLVEGQPVRSCSLPAIEIAGKAVLTAEGLSRDEIGSRLLQRYRSGEETAGRCTPCGRCAPGLLLAALSCIQRAASPPPTETVRAFLRGHPCRCFLQDEIAAAAAATAQEVFA